MITEQAREAHQQMLEDHKQAKAKRREDHKRTGGRKFVYPGFLY